MSSPIDSTPDEDRSACGASHALDRALALQPLAGQPDGYMGHTSIDYWNMVGPFGGVTAAVALQAVLVHPQLLGGPVTLTVNYVAALAQGAFRIQARPVRTNRSTQHWTIEVTQTDAAGTAAVVLTGTAMTALRRDAWSDDEQRMPEVPAAAQLEPVRSAARALFRHYDLRVVEGHVPQRWEDQLSPSRSRLWVRDEPPRPLDFPALAAMSDIFFPRIWLRRARQTPVGTVSMTVYFHADAARLARAGTDHVLAQASGQGYFKGFHDQSAQLWSSQGELLATSHQVVYYKD